jgi:hypothetical protein
LHTVPSPTQAGRGACGAPITGEHVPTLPVTLQASHCPGQSLSQHTPSMQWPLSHCGSELQVWPFGSLSLHTPPEQKLVDEQCACTVQLPRQAVGPQA